MSLKDRWNAESPKVFKWITNFCLAIAAGSGAMYGFMKLNPESFKSEMIMCAALVTAITTGIAAFLSKLTVNDSNKNS